MVGVTSAVRLSDTFGIGTGLIISETYTMAELGRSVRVSALLGTAPHHSPTRLYQNRTKIGFVPYDMGYHILEISEISGGHTDLDVVRGHSDHMPLLFLLIYESVFCTNIKRKVTREVTLICRNIMNARLAALPIGSVSQWPSPLDIGHMMSQPKGISTAPS